MDSELEQLKRRGEEADRIRVHQSSLEDMRKKNKKKRVDRQTKRSKSKTQQYGLTLKEQEAEYLAQKQLAEQICLNADAHFFGFAPNSNKKEALRMYEESECYGNSKAMLALASIYEKGLINEANERGGQATEGVIERPAREPDFQKAYEYYDQASDTGIEPYATFKLGQFMEEGLYDGYRGKPSMSFAFQFYLKAVQNEAGCREALYKLGEIY